VAGVGLDVEEEPLAGGRHHVLVQRVEVRGDPGQDRLGHLRPVGIPVHLAPRGLADAGLRRAGALDDRLEASRGERARRRQRRRLERDLHPRQLGLEAGERLAEEAQRLEEGHHVAADPLGGHEVHDVDRKAPPDPVEAADALLRDERAPGQVEEDEPPTELEVAALAPALGRDEQADPRGRRPSRAGRGG
jgi:hypothetical protein